MKDLDFIEMNQFCVLGNNGELTKAFKTKKQANSFYEKAEKLLDDELNHIALYHNGKLIEEREFLAE